MLARRSDSYLVTLTLMLMSIFCTVRYGYWRLATTWSFAQDPANRVPMTWECMFPSPPPARTPWRGLRWAR